MVVMAASIRSSSDVEWTTSGLEVTTWRGWIALVEEDDDDDVVVVVVVEDDDFTADAALDGCCMSFLASVDPSFLAPSYCTALGLYPSTPRTLGKTPLLARRRSLSAAISARRRSRSRLASYHQLINISYWHITMLIYYNKSLEYLQLPKITIKSNIYTQNPFMYSYNVVRNMNHVM